MVSLQKFGRVYVLTLLGDGEHRFDDESFGNIIGALETVHTAEDAGALVTTNEGKFFSNGMDMEWLRRAKERRVRYNLNSLLAKMLDMNVPTIAAICGHATAAGFIFALAHDHRYMRSDRGFLYMSEMDVRVRIPIATMSVIRSSLSAKAFKDTMLLAKKQTAKEALEAGIVDSVYESPAETLAAAIEFATHLSNRDWAKTFYRNMRLDMHPELLDGLLKENEAGGTSSYKQHASELPSKL